MTKAIAGLTAAILAAGVLGTSAFAAPAKKTAKAMKHHTKMASFLKCPACGMMMPSKASKATPVPVKVGNHTYYCCAGCAAGKAALKNMKHAKHMKKA